MVICLHPAFELRYELKIRIYLGFSYLNKFSDSGSLPVSSINGRVWFAFRSCLGSTLIREVHLKMFELAFW